MLKEKLQVDIKNALKTGNSVKRMVLSLLQSAIKNKELEKRTKLSKANTDSSQIDELSKLSDEEIIDVVSSEVKKRKESIESYKKGGREELAKKEKDEINILMEYLPEQVSEEEIRIEAKKAITEIHSTGSGQTGAKEIKDMGKILAILMPKLKGKADGQTVSRIVKEQLSN